MRKIRTPAMNSPKIIPAEPPCNCIGAGGQIRDRLAWHIVDDFYDGAVAGLVQCREHGSMFLYHLLDWNLGSGRVRIFGVAPLLPVEQQLIAPQLAEHHAQFLNLENPFAWFMSVKKSPRFGQELSEMFEARREIEWAVFAADGWNFLDGTSEKVLSRADFPSEAKWRARRLPNAAWMFRFKAQFDWVAFFKARDGNA